MPATPLARDQVVFRRTNARKGRHISVTPANSATRHLSYGRIILDAEVPEAAFDAGGEEVGLVCFQRQRHGHRGRPGLHPRPLRRDVHSAGLARHRPHRRRRSTSRSSGRRSSTVPAAARPVRRRHRRPGPPLQDRRPLEFAHAEHAARQERRGRAPDGRRHVVGARATGRAGRRTSTRDLAEELYVYYDMPPEAFGIQMVYTDKIEPERIEMVRDGDVVIMPQGLPPERLDPGPPHLVPLGDGRRSRTRGSEVRRGQRPSRFRPGAVRAREGDDEPIARQFRLDGTRSRS